MLIKPQQWGVDPGQVDPEWKWFWKDATAVVPFWEGGGVPQNLVPGKPTITETANTVWGPGRVGVQKEITSTARRFWALGTTLDMCSLTAGSILIVRRKVDTTNRASSLFGIDHADRLHSHCPFSDGNVYWDWAGASGDDRVTWSDYVTTDDVEVWGFTAGPLGHAIYYNGVVQVSNAVAATARSDTIDFHIGDGAAETDLQEFYFAAVFDVEVTAAQVAQWSADYFGPVRRFDDAALFAVVGDINTAEKRRSVSGIPLLMPGVTPNASKDQEWRQEAGWSYSGVLAVAPAGGRIMSSLVSSGGLAGSGGIAGNRGGLVG